MNKTVRNMSIIFLVLIGIIWGLFKENLVGYKDKEPLFESALITAEDVSTTKFHVRYKEVYIGDYYDLPSKDISKTANIAIVGYYESEAKEIYLTSSLTKYFQKADLNMNVVKGIITNNITPDEEFVPKFSNSSYYEYKQCARESKKQVFTCVVSSVVKENYVFSLVLHGTGAVTNSDLENLLETSLKNKHKILNGLP